MLWISSEYEVYPYMNWGKMQQILLLYNNQLMDDEFDQWQDAEVVVPTPTHNTINQQPPEQPPTSLLTAGYQLESSIQPIANKSSPQQQQFVFEDVLTHHPQHQPVQHQQQIPDNQLNHVLGAVQTTTKSSPQIDSNNTVEIGDYLGISNLVMASTNKQPTQLPVQYTLAVEEQDEWVLPAYTINTNNMEYGLTQAESKQQPQTTINSTINPIANSTSIENKADDDWQWQGAPTTNNHNTTPTISTTTAYSQHNITTQPAQQAGQDDWVESKPVATVEPAKQQKQQQDKPNDQQQWEYTSSPVQQPLSISQPVAQSKVEEEDGFGDYEGNNEIILNPQPVLSQQMQSKIAAFIDSLPDYSYISASCFIQI